MSNLLREYVQALPDSEKLLIIQGYEKFEQDGVIGDEPIRIQTVAFLNSHSIPYPGTITLWMDKIAFECYRYFSKKYVKEQANNVHYRQMMIDWIKRIINPGDRGRYQPVVEWWYSNVLKKDPETKQGRKECKTLDIATFDWNLLLTNITDEQLVELHELVVWRYSQQR